MMRTPPVPLWPNPAEGVSANADHTVGNRPRQHREQRRCNNGPEYHMYPGTGLVAQGEYRGQKRVRE